MAFPALQDGIWGNVNATIAMGILRAPFTKFSPGKIEVKVEKVRRVGEALPRKRTVGGAELADSNGEMLANDFEENILNRWGRHGATLIEFGIIVRAAHPAIAGNVSTWLSETRIVSLEGPEVDGSAPEKPLIYKIGFSSMGRFEKGRDNVWKCLYFDPRRPAGEAVPVIPF